MGLPNVLCVPGDRAINPLTIPGTRRTYSCAPGASISVPGEDANILCSSGWTSAVFPNRLNAGLAPAFGTTAQRPTGGLVIGQLYSDTTAGFMVMWQGPKIGWVHHQTGASA